ncbi:M4 family metallopeptidase, partial [Nocardioides stalactiti]|uniref:M4 family metallopeptidase n=1 Tax=Nocardioides stalactiti TaxID=2755356 RepID=UPI0015FFA1E7
TKGPTSVTDPGRPPHPDRDDRAEAASREVVAARAPQLFLGRHDRVRAQQTLRSGHLRFVPYERTHRGLRVVGGDFVVVVDGDDVVYTSVAQTAQVRLPDVEPSVSATDARATASGRLTRSRAGRSELVVLQRGARSDLAWATSVTGRRAGQPSRLEVYVDAESGAVLRSDEAVSSGEGNGGWNGPNPLPIVTRKVGTTYQMTMGSAPTMTCQDFATRTTLTGPDDVWGDGNPATVETGCVDALYGAQQMKSMMSTWLGRQGMNGNGGWLPIRVGLDEQNAFYYGTHVEFGRNPSGQWVTSLDITGHEFGHGVDDQTPGGLSRGNTSEFIADTFGTATEWWDNQASPHDVRDFLIGEEVALAGTGDGTAEIRNMANPSLEGDPNCYTAAIDSHSHNLVHTDSGPGDHWFYLASQGSQPASGPVSPVCSGPRVFGIGIAKVMKVLYTAMLMKTSASSYQKYRLWTLVAARHLYGQSTCTEFNRVKAAWNAVSVPAQAGEGTCTVGEASVRVTNAIHRKATAGTTITPFTMTAAGGTTPYTWSATGLPAGLGINAATGQVSGSLATYTGGSWTVAVTATDDVGRLGRGWFTFQVSNATSNACSNQRVGNAGFEYPTPAPWVMEGGSQETNPSLAHTGNKFAWIGGWGASAPYTETMRQSVRVPAGCKATLSFWVKSHTAEGMSSPFDYLEVRAGSTLVHTQSNVDATATWVKHTYVLPASLSGKTFDLTFTSVEDSSNWTNFHVDDVGLNLSTP